MFTDSQGGFATQFVPPQAQEMMIDYYDFFAAAEKQTVSGRKRVTAMQGPAAAPYDGSSLVDWQYDAAMNLIEVQTGSYLGEDDITRFEDAYARR